MKIAIDVVEGIERFHGTGGVLNPVYWDWFLGARLLPRLVDRTFVISHGLAERCRRLAARDVRLLPAIESWPSQPPTWVEGSCVFHLLYVGGLTAKEDPALLLSLVKKISDMSGRVQLSIVGRYQDSHEGRVNAERISRTANGDCVVMHDAVSDSVLASLKLRSNGFLLLRADSTAERLAFPTRLVEFLKMGRPVWTSNIGDTGSYLRDGISAFLLSPDMKEAAQHLSCTLSNRGIHRPVALAGFAVGREKFDRTGYGKSLAFWERGLESP